MSAANPISLDCADDEIRLNVSRFLCSRHFPAFRYLDIQVDQGTVTLVGEVQSYYEKQVAMTSTHNVAGVVSIVDGIVVNPVGVMEEANVV
jgi:osmotically-inducible protein OsmY